MKHLTALLTLPALCAAPLMAQQWQDIVSIEDLCSAYPAQVEHLFESLNLDYPGLEQVKKAYLSKKLPTACQALLDYYESNGKCAFLRQDIPEESAQSIPEVEGILQNKFVVQMVEGQVPTLPNGHRNWHYHGPDNNPDWSWLSNRHEQLEQVYDAYLQTGNKKYAEYLDAFLRDFITYSLPYTARRSSDAIWRGLEISYRAKRWSKFFYGMIQNPAMQPATKILLLSSLPDHAHYNRNFHGQNNWLTMELSALATVASYFPEFKESPEWWAYSLASMEKSMQGQVYPDGVQNELTTHYHDVAVRNFEVLKTLADQTGASIPSSYIAILESMYEYTAMVLRPSGHLPLNNDGDRRDRRDILLAAAEHFKRPDWSYIATNGQQGEEPKKGPSAIYPWAGQLISRSGYDADAQWSFFDVGPWGCAHEHCDKLHLSISAYGRDLLVDSGRFAYMGDVATKFRGYAVSSRAHNTITIDGKGQGAGPAKVQVAISEDSYKITDKADYATASFANFPGIAGSATHSRSLYYLRGQAWLVIDHIKTDRPRLIECLWHFHPDCSLVLKDSIVQTDNERGNLAIVPLGGQKWQIKMIKGQEKPYLQGWYSEEYNSVEPNGVAEYQTYIEADSSFAWLLYPSEKPAAKLNAKIVEQSDSMIRVRFDDASGQEVLMEVALTTP